MKYFTKSIRENIVIVSIFFCTKALFAGGADTCLANDDCQSAILISNIIADQAFVCISGCNEYSSPDTIVAGCQMGDYPTVWYSLTTDSFTTVLNIEVTSIDFDAPSLSMFSGNAGCGALEQVYLAGGNLPCLIGADGGVQAVGTAVTPLTTYYVAVSSLFSVGGEFEICISALKTGSYCVVDRDIEVISRSNGGPLEGPFDPGEKIKLCLNVNAFTPQNNGCQWFQGIIPSFGNGWDPASFDADLQPYNSTVNDLAMGLIQNGVYGEATWDWFGDVDYHHDNPRLNIGDYDNNGRYELCNNIYEMECQNQNGIPGGCCGPCWDTIGTILPPGWFAYGINGSCPLEGPPVGVDWGDGNSCGSNMGSWSFCFDVVARDTPDCLGDSTKNDLTVGFYTFADGETGSWTGGESVCALDQPLKLSLKALCGRITRRETEYLPTINSEDLFTYIVDDREISNWEWNISPYWAMPYVINRGENGVLIENQVFNPTGEPVDIRIILIGHEAGSQDLTIKNVEFTVNPWTTSIESPYDAHSMSVFPNPTNHTVNLKWPDEIVGSKELIVYNSQGMTTASIQLNNSVHQHALDLNHYPRGLYFVNLVTRSKIYTARLVKQ